MADRVPKDPDSLRKKSRAYRAATASESNPERRRAYMLIASEYDKLAETLESEFDTQATDGVQARPVKERTAPKPR